MDDDPVVQERDIFISTQLASYLHILHLSGTIQELEHDSTSITGRYKKTHKLLELELPLDTSHHTYSKDKGEELGMTSTADKTRTQEKEMGQKSGKLESVVFSGSKAALGEYSKYFVAFGFKNTIHMTPVENLISMKPNLKYLDESEVKTKNAIKKPEVESNTDEKLKAVQIQFKKRETEEQMAARLSSYAYLQRQVEEEPWITLAHFLPDSEESRTVCERLLSSTVKPIEFR